MPIGFEVDDVWQARSRGFQMGAVQPKGIVIHLTGQVAWSIAEEVVGKGDVEAQTRQIFETYQDYCGKWAVTFRTSLPLPPTSRNEHNFQSYRRYGQSISRPVKSPFPHRLWLPV
jgi:hypothetical protein